MSAQNKNSLVSQIESFDPFPEPHTFPSGWDLSELYPGYRPALTVEDEHSTNNQSNNPGMPIQQSSVD